MIIRRIGIGVLKIAICAAVLLALFRNPSLGWTLLCVGALWFLIESRDSGAHALYANVMRFVMPATVSPFVLMGLRDVEFVPTSHQLFWLCFLVPIVLGCCTAWLIPRIGESAAYRDLQSENRDAEAQIQDLREKWGSAIQKPNTRREITIS